MGADARLLLAVRLRLPQLLQHVRLGYYSPFGYNYYGYNYGYYDYYRLLRRLG